MNVLLKFVQKSLYIAVMKKLTLALILAILTSSAFSREYNCDVRNYRLTIDLEGDRSTHVWVRDLNTYSVLHQGYAGSVDRGQRVSSFHFYGQQQPITISFRNSDIKEQGDKIKGHIEATLEGFYFRDYMNCRSRR